MTFKKDDPQTKEWGMKGNEAKKKYKENLWEYMATGGIRAYHEKMEKLKGGEELSKPEQQFMDRSERLMPYIKAKRQAIEGHDGGAVEVDTNITIEFKK